MKKFIQEKYKHNNLNDNTNVVIAHIDSPLANELFVKSEELITEIQKHKMLIDKGYYKNNFFSLEFNNILLNLTLGKCDIYNIQRGYTNSYTGVIIDYYDFSWLDECKSLKQLLKNVINDYAVIQQEDERLENYVLLIPFVLFENDSL